MFNKMNKQLAILFSLLLVLMNISVLQPDVVGAEDGSEAVTVTAINNDGSTVVETVAIEINEGDTAEDVLLTLEAEQEVTIDLESFDFGNSIIGIEDVYDSDETYWAVILNGAMAPKGISDLTVENGDNLLFLLSDPGFHVPTVNAELSIVDHSGVNIVNRESLELVKHATAYDALVQATKKHDLALDVTVHPEYFTFINNIANADLAEDEFWQFLINGEDAFVGVLGHTILADDHFTFTLQPYDDNGNGNEEDDDDADSSPKPTALTKEEINEIVQDNINSIVNYYETEGKVEQFGQEWFAWGLANATGELPEAYVTNIEQTVSSEDFYFDSVTSLELLIITLAAANIDVTNVAGVNLLEQLENDDRLTDTVTHAIYGLIALNSVDEPVDTHVENELIDYILSKELANGGWNYFGDDPSADITGMALIGLAPYKNRDDVSVAVDRAIDLLSEMQASNGGYYDEWNGGYTSESVSQVIIGLIALGIDPTDEQFTKEQGNLMEHLLMFRTEEGLYQHVVDEGKANDIAISQALVALTYYNNFINEESKIDKTDNDDETNGTGADIPETATPVYNILLIGFIVIASGFVIFIVQRKRQNS